MMNFSVKNNIICNEKENWKIIDGGIGKALFSAMKKYFPRTAQIDARTGDHDTYETLLRKCIRLALYLQKLRVSRDDIVGLCSDNNLNACIPIIASQFIGVRTFATDPDQTVEDTATTMGQTPPRIMFTTKNLFKKTKEATIVANVTPEIITFENDTFREIIDKPNTDEATFSPVNIDNLNDTAVFHSTSGSTGVPKIVEQSHNFNLWSLGEFAKIFGCYDDDGDKKQEIVHFGWTWFWGAATRYLLASISHGACMILPQPSSAMDLIDYVERYKVAYMSVSPMQIHDLSTHADLVRKSDTSSLRALVAQGSGVHLSYIENLRKALPHVAVYNSYGQTETAICFLYDIRNKKHRDFMAVKPRSCGVPVPGLSFKIADPHTEEALGPNKPGEIRVKTKRLSTYLNRDISEKIDNDGFYQTGDVGYYDEDLCFFVVGRIKDEFKYQLWHVSPGFLENVIFGHPAVARVVVVGKPHHVDGYLPTALVVLKENYGETTSEEIEKFVEKRVDDRLRLRGGVKYLKGFPMTAAGKVDRVLLKKMVENEEI